MPEPRLGSLEHRNFESIIDKIAPKAFTKQQKTIPKCIKNNFHQKSIFAIPSMSEPRLGSPEHRNFESVIDLTSSQGSKKTTKTNPKMH